MHIAKISRKNLRITYVKDLGQLLRWFRKTWEELRKMLWRFLESFVN